MASTKMVLAFLKEKGINKENTNLKKVFHNDLHTGLGPFGHDTLLTTSDDMSEKVIAVLGEGESASFLGSDIGKWHVEAFKVEDGEAQGTAYESGGNIMDGLHCQLGPEGCDWTCLTQEFGTKKAIEVLRILRAENAMHHLTPGE